MAKQSLWQLVIELTMEWQQIIDNSGNSIPSP